jgi:hypothetical protein
MPLHRAIKDQGIENFSFEVIKTVEFIDDQHLLILKAVIWINMTSFATAMTQSTASLCLIYIRLFIILYCSL